MIIYYYPENLLMYQFTHSIFCNFFFLLFLSLIPLNIHFSCSHAFYPMFWSHLIDMMKNVILSSKPSEEMIFPEVSFDSYFVSFNALFGKSRINYIHQLVLKMLCFSVPVIPWGIAQPYFFFLGLFFFCEWGVGEGVKTMISEQNIIQISLDGHCYMTLRNPGFQMSSLAKLIKVL